MNSCAAFRSTRSFSTVTVVFLLTSTILALSTRCHAQVTKLNTDDLMDIVFDMKKAASTADKFAADGSKYCHWGLVSLDASDLDLVVSRFLLNRGSVVPADISASKMWHVDFIAGDLINQLEMGLQECNVGVRINSGARDVAVASKPVLLKFIDARQRFDRLAYEQTAWQERKRAMPGDGDENLRVPAVDASDILGASLEVREVVEIGTPASNIVAEAEKSGYDLIVMSTHGRTGFAHMVIGSVTEQVLRSATCPVFSVRPPKEPSKLGG